jgi:hypothetical protein
LRRRQAKQRTLQHDESRLGRGAALAGQDIAQRDAVDEFHDDGGARRRFDIFVKPDDVRIIQRGQRGGLAAEHLGEFLVGQQVMAQVFDRHQDTRRVVPGQYYLAESA